LAEPNHALHRFALGDDVAEGEGAGRHPLHAGELALERGDTEGAARVLVRARDLRPDDPAIRRSLDGLQVDGPRMRANITDETLSEARRLGIDVSAPEDYLGAAGVFVDRALALYRA